MNIIDLCFPLAGTTLPRDHGYAVYSAIASAAPPLHQARWLGVHPIGGKVANDRLHLGRHAELRLRAPAERIPDLLPLAGRRLRVNETSIRLGAPVVFSLAPSASLDARIVLLKVTRPPTKQNASLGRDVIDNDALAERYQSELRRQLDSLEIAGTLSLCGRQSIRIHGRRVVGFSVRVADLSDAESVRLQERGLGGRRPLGCGIFRPTRGK